MFYRFELPAPVTIIAKSGLIVATDEGQQVLVYDGSRQDFNEKTGALNRLDFERYSIDLPEAVAVGKRWKEASEGDVFLAVLSCTVSRSQRFFRTLPRSAMTASH